MTKSVCIILFYYIKKNHIRPERYRKHTKCFTLKIVMPFSNMLNITFCGSASNVCISLNNEPYRSHSYANRNQLMLSMFFSLYLSFVTPIYRNPTLYITRTHTHTHAYSSCVGNISKF